eukprot:2074688-Amphidinium_carterae.2
MLHPAIASGISESALQGGGFINCALWRGKNSPSRAMSLSGNASSARGLLELQFAISAFIRLGVWASCSLMVPKVLRRCRARGFVASINAAPWELPMLRPVAVKVENVQVSVRGSCCSTSRGTLKM